MDFVKKSGMFDKAIIKIASAMAKHNIPRHLDAIEKEVQSFRNAGPDFKNVKTEENIIPFLREVENLTMALKILEYEREEQDERN